jgi:hypothetical protein
MEDTAMNENRTTPAEIEAIIERKRQALLEEKHRKEEAERREREETEAIGRAKYDEYIQASMLKVPEYLRRHVSPTDNVPDFYRIGKGWENPSDWLYFQVPGLARILFAPQAKDNPWKYQNAHPGETRYWEGETIYVEPSLSFSDRQYGWTDDVEYALGMAQKNMKDYQQYVAEYEARQEEIEQDEASRRNEKQEAVARETDLEAKYQAEQEAKERQEQAEEAALFDAIKNDPIAIHMLKAFVLLRDERNNFEQRLENADEAIYSIENRWSRRAEELRRQADDAERRAEDDRRRLQDDLDDAEAKIKKANRGW